MPSRSSSAWKCMWHLPHLTHIAVCLVMSILRRIHGRVLPVMGACRKTHRVFVFRQTFSNLQMRSMCVRRCALLRSHQYSDPSANQVANTDICAATTLSDAIRRYPRRYPTLFNAIRCYSTRGRGAEGPRGPMGAEGAEGPKGPRGRGGRGAEGAEGLRGRGHPF